MNNQQDLNKNSETEVEIVADFELAVLVEHHTFTTPFSGFFYGSTEVLKGLYYMPDHCSICQEEEVRK